MANKAIAISAYLSGISGTEKLRDVRNRKIWIHWNTLINVKSMREIPSSSKKPYLIGA